MRFEDSIKHEDVFEGRRVAPHHAWLPSTPLRATGPTPAALPSGTQSTTLGGRLRDSLGGGSLVGGGLTNQRMHGGRIGGHQLRGDMDAGPPQQRLGVLALLG